MISFENDYAEGCHPKILEALARTNLEQLSRQVRFSVWGKYDGGRTVARFVTSWAIPQENIDTLSSVLDGLG